MSRQRYSSGGRKILLRHDFLYRNRVSDKVTVRLSRPRILGRDKERLVRRCRDRERCAHDSTPSARDSARTVHTTRLLHCTIVCTVLGSLFMDTVHEHC